MGTNKPVLLFQIILDLIRYMLTLWKVISIGYWIIGMMVNGLSITNFNGKILSIIIFLLIFIIICLHVIGSIKALYISNIIIIIITFLCCIGIYLFEWNSAFVGFCFLGIGISAIYTLKVRGLDTKIKPFNDTKQKRKEKVIDSENVPGDNSNVKCIVVQMKNVHDANQWDNIDRQQSIKL